MIAIPDLSRLKALRQSLGWSQHDLARHAGVSQSLIAKIEAGTLDPSLSNAQKIAQALIAKMPKEKMVKQVMSKHVLSFSSETSLLEVVRIMRKKGISLVPVIDGDLVVGKITESVILDNVEKISTGKSKDIMLPPPPMVDASTAVSAIIPLVQSYNAILVLEKGIVVGIVTKSDVMAAALR